MLAVNRLFIIWLFALVLLAPKQLMGIIYWTPNQDTRISLMDQISTPEVKCGVKSREPEIKSAENICFYLKILLGDLS